MACVWGSRSCMPCGWMNKGKKKGRHVIPRPFKRRLPSVLVQRQLPSQLLCGYRTPVDSLW
jgi:hypothetical protein